MLCPKCNHPIDDNSTFCNHCGTAIAQQPQQPAAPKPSVSKLVLGILSCVFAVAIFGTAPSDSAGSLVALLTLAAGILGICGRKSRGAGMTAAFLFFGAAVLCMPVFASSLIFVFWSLTLAAFSLVFFFQSARMNDNKKMKPAALVVFVVLCLVYTVLFGVMLAAVPVPITQDFAAPPASDATQHVQQNDPVSWEITYQTSRVYVNSIGDTVCDILCEITNTGSKNLYLASSSFDFERADGSLISTCDFISTMPDVIAPGEKGYFYCAGSTVNNITPEDEYTLKADLNVKESYLSPVRLAVSDLSITTDAWDGVCILGRAQNNTGEEQTSLRADAVLFDADGTPIGVIGTSLDALEDGDSTSFEMSSAFSFDEITLDRVADYRVVVSPWQLQF